MQMRYNILVELCWKTHICICVIFQ